MYHELAIDARGPAVVSGLFSVCPERCRGTLSEGLRITSWRTLCDGDSPERSVFFDPYPSVPVVLIEPLADLPRCARDGAVL